MRTSVSARRGTAIRDGSPCALARMCWQKPGPSSKNTRMSSSRDSQGCPFSSPAIGTHYIVRDIHAGQSGRDQLIATQSIWSWASRVACADSPHSKACWLSSSARYQQACWLSWPTCVALAERAQVGQAGVAPVASRDVSRPEQLALGLGEGHLQSCMSANTDISSQGRLCQMVRPGLMQVQGPQGPMPALLA